MQSSRPILLVEDSPDDVELTLRALRSGRVLNEVIVARDGAEAIERLFGKSPESAAVGLKPGLVLLDLKLPKVGGLDVLKRIREDPRTRLLPVIIFTSSREESDVIRGYELGANSYVQKPVDFTQFIDAVQQLGLYWLLVNLAPP